MPRAPASSGLLGKQYDSDPLHTGHLDANRGAAFAADLMAQASSVLTLKARVATTAEKAKINAIGDGTDRYALASMIASAGACAFYPGAAGTADVIAEGRIRRTASPSPGAHDTIWTQAVEPLNVADQDAQSADEHDSEGTGPTVTFNRNVWQFSGSGGHIYAHGYSWTKTGAYRREGFRLNKSTTAYMLDGAVVEVDAYSSNTKDKLSQLLVTNHFDNGATEAQLAAKDQLMEVDDLRVWTRTGKAFLKPLVSVAPLNLARGATGSIVLPSKADLWGDATVDEYVQMIRFEENEPGVPDRYQGFTRFPAGVTYNAGTRTLSFASGITSGADALPRLSEEGRMRGRSAALRGQCGASHYGHQCVGTGRRDGDIRRLCGRRLRHPAAEDARLVLAARRGVVERRNRHPDLCAHSRRHRLGAVVTVTNMSDRLLRQRSTSRRRLRRAPGPSQPSRMPFWARTGKPWRRELSGPRPRASRAPVLSAATRQPAPPPTRSAARICSTREARTIVSGSGL